MIETGTHGMTMLIHEKHGTVAPLRFCQVVLFQILMSLLPQHSRVLVVDDNADAAELMTMLLQMEGFMVEATVTGLDALARALAFMPQVICIDIELHDLPGDELVRQIRQHPALADARLIGMTGWDEAHAPDPAARRCFDSVYLKPVTIDAFATEIRRHCYR